MKEPRQRVVVANPADGGLIYWLFKFYLFGFILLCMAGVSTVPAIYLAVAAEVPPPPDLTEYQEQAELESYIVAADGTRLTTLAQKYRYLVPISQVPPLVIKAFLAAEDRSFFRHGGVDFRGILRAAWANLRAGGVRQGGSTITQQVAKSYLSSKRTIQRKLREVVLARRMEARFTKQEILYIYLNKIFFGSQAYGIKAAAQIYFGKRLDQLDVAEVALLAGLVRAPSRYSPRAHPERAVRRRNQVIDAMHDMGVISAAQRRRARAAELRIKPRRTIPPPPAAPHFTEHVRRSLIARHGKGKVYTAGWRVETTVDLPLQSVARRRVLTSVRALDKRQGWRGPLMRVRSAREREQLLRRVRRLHDTTRLEVGTLYPMLVEEVRSSRVRGRIGDREVQIPLSLMSWAAPYSRTNAENERTIASAKGVLEPGDVVWTMAPASWMRRKSWGTPDDRRPNMALHQVPRVEGALYLYDHQTGEVLAMVGGLDYDRSTYNRCTQACRQPGSTYKPIYYSLALDSDQFSMATILHDKPYEPEPGEEWNPQNVHGTLDGKVTMHMSLVRSLNLPSIELLNKVGAKAAARWARRLGFTTPIHADKALALGASCVRTDELTRAFATFVRGGTRMDPRYLRRIVDRHGEVVEDHTLPTDPHLDEADRLDRVWATSRLQPRRDIDRRTAFLITKLLRDSVTHGIAARCQIVPVPVGGKGGTSSDTMDVWFVGFTSRWAMTTWIGDDTYQRPLGEKEASYTSAIPLWANFAREVLSVPCDRQHPCPRERSCTRGLCPLPNRPHDDLPLSRPPGLKSTVMDYITGGPPQEGSKTVRIYFKPGTYHPPRDEG